MPPLGDTTFSWWAPGSGKSMLARRFPSILPPLSQREALEATQIHSVMGLTTKEHPLLTQRPFRAPHHTISAGRDGRAEGIPTPGRAKSPWPTMGFSFWMSCQSFIKT